ncbi:MAG: DUF1015 domain-containing protein [Candidatus Omnitrophica bacterium]|nr:DUF1015 domain-containing protein [Candidatus Omnitrophota bacterium]
MAEIIPFCGLRYNRKKVKNIKGVFAPPYDVISEKQQGELYRQHPLNIIRLILGKQSKNDDMRDNRYTRAGNLLQEWIKTGILVKDAVPSIYIYTQDYVFDGVSKKRVGFLARMKLEKGNECLPHEHTLAKPKQDRVKLIRAVQANLSPIFTFYIDKKNEIENILKSCIRKKPLISFKDKENIMHRFWQVGKKNTIERIRKLMRRKKTFIADGHHRYEVSLSYLKEMSRKKGSNGEFNSVMMYFTGFNDQNLSVMPTHRLVKAIPDIQSKINSLGDYFKVSVVKNLKEMLSAQAGKDGFSLGMCYKNKFYVLEMKDDQILDKLMRKSPAQWRRLDVAMLNSVVFEHIFKLKEKQKEEKISYTRDPQYAVECVKSEKASAAFFPNTTKAEQVKKIALSGNRMPQKSTYFYPKPVTGLVINKF